MHVNFTHVIYLNGNRFHSTSSTNRDEDKENQVVNHHQYHSMNDDTDSDSDSEATVKWRDYYGDDERIRRCAKIARKDSLAIKLAQRPDKQELIAKNILPVMTDQEKLERREIVSHALTRRLSLRPTPEELEQRNILRTQSEEEMINEKEHKKQVLDRKVKLTSTFDTY